MAPIIQLIQTYEHSDWEKEVQVQLWDTAGQERYRSLTRAFLRDGMGFLLLFDLTNIESFRHTESWIGKPTPPKRGNYDATSEEIREKTICEDPDIILVGNKSDMEDKRQVPRAAAVSLAEAHKYV